MQLQYLVALLIRLLLAGWLSVTVHGIALIDKFEHNGEAKKLLDPVISHARKIRDAQSSLRALPPIPKYLYFNNDIPENKEIKLDDNGVLECEVAGSPQPVIHWLKDGELISTDDLEKSKLPIQGVSSTISRLFIDCMTPEDRGLYTCSATTYFHHKSKDTFVNFSNTPVMFSPSCLEREVSRVVHQGRRPRIHTFTSYLLQDMGTDAVLFCRATGDPMPTIEWSDEYKQEKIIPDGVKFNILDNGDLQIRNLMSDDMTRYACHASNIFGEDKTSAFLYPFAVNKK